MAELPTIVTGAGLQPLAPADLRAMLIALVAATNPGYTANLPGTLIEDIASTDVGALVMCDQARVDLVNSLTPLGANDFLLLQLGQIYGLKLGGPFNTSVEVQFTATFTSSGAVVTGYVIPAGFVVSDGTYQYVVQDGGITGSSGTSQPMTAIANQTGTWSVPPGTVNQLATSVPLGITLTVTNPQAGTPSVAAETMTQFRTRVLQAGLAASTGMTSYLKTLLANLPGVEQRLISVRAIAGGDVGSGQPGFWEVIVGGGDDYQVANAIFQAVPDIIALSGSIMSVSGVTQASNGIVTTALNHGLTTGTVAKITGALGMTQINNVPFTITVLTETTFELNVDTSGYPAYISGGVVSPNPRNVQVTIYDYPDTYLIPIVRPPLQTVDVIANWNTTQPNFVDGAAIATLAAPALVDYINSIPVGQPLNIYRMQTVFQQAVQDVLSPDLLTRLIFTVSVNGIGETPDPGTGIIPGDPESYFFATSGSVLVAQG